MEGEENKDVVPEETADEAADVEEREPTDEELKDEESSDEAAPELPAEITG
jgi:hypothetical protein